MRSILARTGVARLAHLGRSRTLLVFDFDGTLAPIVARRESASMRARTARLLTLLCALYPCAVVSGRGRADVLARLAGVPFVHVVGNHGLEPDSRGSPHAARVRAARLALQRVLRDEVGVEVEDKVHSLAIHYRHTPSPRAAAAVIRRAAAELAPELRLVGGKSVVNLVPAHGPHKGRAVLRLGRLTKAEAILFVGDDVTDEDVFSLPRSERVTTVRVGRSRSTAAEYFVPGQRDIDALLVALVRARLRPAAGLAVREALR